MEAATYYDKVINLFRLNARRPDDRPPLLGLRPMEGRKGLRRLLLARHDLLAQVGKSLAHPRLGQRVHGRGVEPRDDIPGRTFWGKQRVPDGTVEPGQSGLVHCWNIRGRREAALAGHRKGLDVAAACLRQRGRLVGEYQVDLSG